MNVTDTLDRSRTREEVAATKRAEAERLETLLMQMECRSSTTQDQRRAMSDMRMRLWKIEADLRELRS